MYLQLRTKFQKPQKTTPHLKMDPLKSPPRLTLSKLSRKLLILLFLFAVLLFPFPVLLCWQTNNICILKLLNVFQAFFFDIFIVEQSYAKMQEYFHTIIFSKANLPVPVKLLLMYFSFSVAYPSFKSNLLNDFVFQKLF